MYLLDVLVVIVYMSYCNCWDYLLLQEDWGQCSEDWAGACRWGGGGLTYSYNACFYSSFLARFYSSLFRSSMLYFHLHTQCVYLTGRRHTSGSRTPFWIKDSMDSVETYRHRHTQHMDQIPSLTHIMAGWPRSLEHTDTHNIWIKPACT